MKQNTRLWPIAALLLTFFVTSYVVAETVYKVKFSDNLNRVVSKFYPKSNYSRAQIMVAILVKNPDAFKNGNINFLLRGKQLKLPNDGEISLIPSGEAKVLISQHAISFKRGLTGAFSTPLALNETIQKQKTLAEVKEQTNKIAKLKAEGDALKKQLDKLFKEKQQRDQELRELEETIKQVSTQSQEQTKGGSASAPLIEKKNEKLNEKLKETNEILQQKLIESKSELAENARSTMILERKLSNLRERMTQERNATDSPANQLNQEQVTSSGVFSNLKDKLFWVLPLIILLAGLFLLWRLIKWFINRPKKAPEEETDYEKDYAALIDEYDSKDYLNPENIEEEEELESSIKLDVARAYLEADDTESALNILEEVIKAGDIELKKEAQEILTKIKA